MERRRAPRVAPEGIITVRLLAPGRLETGILIDLNNAGAFVATELVLEKGETVHIEFNLPGGDTMPLQSVVARCCEEVRGKDKVIPQGLGLVFVSDTPEERQHIQEVVMSTLTLDLLKFSREQAGEKERNKTRPM